MYRKSIEKTDFTALLPELETLHDCAFCPRNCHADRFSETLGYCKAGAGFSISTICLHHGEEPVISGPRGICNIFFTNCNLQCIYCQNNQISNNSGDHSRDQMDIYEIAGRISGILETGINIVGFVSPSHFIPQMKIIIRAVELSGFKPTWVYNTNGYDKVDTLRSLEDIVDVYLPDFKYSDPILAREFSDAPDYPKIALEALKEMYRQKGSRLPVNEEGYAESGILIRHLVLPGQQENTRKVLKLIAEELSPRLHIGLMSQYYPTEAVKTHPALARSISSAEYALALKALDEFGFGRGFIQGLTSFRHYRPDFDKTHPFEPD